MFSMGGLSSLGLGPAPEPQPVTGQQYLVKLHKYLSSNIARLAPPIKRRDGTWLQQGYTVLTLGLDPNSAPLSPNVKVPLTLGFGTPAAPRTRPVLLRLPPDKLLYLLLRWQSLPQNLPHVGRTDVPVPPGVPVAARGARADSRSRRGEGDVESVRSWVGSIRSVSTNAIPGGWFGRSTEMDEDKLLLDLYAICNTLPGLLLHPPFSTDPPVAELMDAGGYTQLGGIDVRVPLDVFRNLQTLELESLDPRSVLAPINPVLHSLTVHDVEDGDEWLVDLLVAQETDETLGKGPKDSTSETPDDGEASKANGDKAAEETPDANGTDDDDHTSSRPRFPNLRHLSLHHVSLLSFPRLPLQSLSHLDLSHNLLNDLPDLSQLSHLTSLNLAHNVIGSVRSAQSFLGNIAALNLSHNRIDCLVGLDRVPGLKRVDLRHNEISDPGEVGRLAVLPQVAEVWVAGNPLSGEFRAEISAAFAAEGKDVLLDDTPLAWSERKMMEELLRQRGRAVRRIGANRGESVAVAPQPRPRVLSPSPRPPAALPEADAQERSASPGSPTPKPRAKPKPEAERSASPPPPPLATASPDTATTDAETTKTRRTGAARKKKAKRRVVALE